MTLRVSTAVLAAGLALATPPAFGSDIGFIYGQVTTDEGHTYLGQIRWGKEEAFWDDIFNATKAKNENLEYIDDKVLDSIRRERSGWDFLLSDDDDDFGHLFAIRFGDLKRLRVLQNDRLVVEFRNGAELELRGGSNDVGARITVLDPKRGTQEIAWDRIRTIEFRETPAKLDKAPGAPLFGTVRTARLEFTGHIQWDHDECLTTDKLDGETSEGDASIAFGDIASIRKHRSGAMVTLASGAEMYVRGSNDVNHENRGVVVKVPDVGSVKIGWDDFEDITFQRPAKTSGRGYATYGSGRKLTGAVVSRGGQHSGDIVFDLDEAWDFELLHGMNGDTEYLIPFREIARIEPKGRYRSEVVLRSGITIELEDSQDVTRKNNGLLIFTKGDSPEYVAWGDVKEVAFH